ncbi:MAG: hypothetical protein EA397_05665 [Deltaproteobacteria bacterium]|nr:MAG: hypothetical protein EA397_05665 [Deltaproteobacteria bacterium]
MATPRWFPFYFAGGFSLFVLVILGVAGALFVPTGSQRAPPEAPAWSKAPGAEALRGWLDQTEGSRVVSCPLRGLDVASSSHPSPGLIVAGAWIQGATEKVEGSALFDSAGDPVGWISVRGSSCAVLSPSQVKVRGQTVRADGSVVPGAAVHGCGQRTSSDVEGRFELRLDAAALGQAREGAVGPQCLLRAEGPPTAVALDRTGQVDVLVQVGP